MGIARIHGLLCRHVEAERPKRVCEGFSWTLPLSHTKATVSHNLTEFINEGFVMRISHLLIALVVASFPISASADGDFTRSQSDMRDIATTQPAGNGSWECHCLCVSSKDKLEYSEADIPGKCDGTENTSPCEGYNEDGDNFKGGLRSCGDVFVQDPPVR